MIGKLMELGVMVEPEAAKILEKGDADKLLKKIRRLEPMPFSINEKLARQLLAEPAQVKTVKKITEMKGMSVMDFVAGYAERYSVLQRILLKNPLLSGALSINSASGPCCVIGLVKNNNREIDDPSGAKALVTDRRDLADGDVAGAIGTAENGTFRASEIIFPDVQLKERADVFGTITAGLPGDCAVRTDATAFYDANSMPIAVSHAKLDKDSAVELLRRRHLTVPPKDFLEPQPAFLIVNSGENFTANYKGVTIIGIKNGSRAEIDLNTRETVFRQV